MKLLVIRRRYLGDLVLISPLFANLRAKWPEAWITLACDERYTEIYSEHPHADEVLAIPEKRGGQFGQWLKLLATVRKRRFDALYDLTRNNRTAMLVKASRAARRAGYQTEGLEISEWAAEQSRKQFGLAVKTGAIDDFDPAGVTYDVVVLFHVLEHLPDPLGALRRIRSWLNPGGAILVEVPNCDSDDAKGYGPEWKGWQPKYHLSHFNPETLRRSLREAGFREPIMQYGRSAFVRRRLKKVPVAGLFRCCVDRFYRGDWMRALAVVADS